MKIEIKNILNTINRFSFLAVMLALFICVTGYTVKAKNNPKVSDKLAKRMDKVSGSDFVDVIINPTADWTGSLTTELKNRGALQKNSYANFSFQVFKVKRSDIDNISSRSDVDFLALDDSVKTLGLMTTTTGANAVRNINGTTNPLNGTGIGIVIVDSGIDPNHVSFKDAWGFSRIVYNQDFTGENRTNDPYGHGTHVASIAAGNASVAGGNYEGIASNAKLINLRVLNSNGTGSISGILAALDWIYTNRANTTYNMKVVNLSLGTSALDSYKNDPLCKAVRKLVDAGIVVVAAAGNEGKDGTGKKIYGQIHSPGNDPSAITVGATNSYGTSIRSDDTMATYSSHGPTRSFYTDASGVRHFDNLVKPDLVAPGNKIIDAESYPGTKNNLVAKNPTLDSNVSIYHSKDQMYLSGTSMATPAVSGAVAMMLQANPKLTPNMIKMLLMYTAQPLNGFNQFEQGAGQLNVDGAVRLGKLVRQDLTSTTLVGSPFLTTSAPTPQSTIQGQTFTWGQGIITKYSFATGTNLITKYQKVYGLGVLLSDGVVISNGVLLSDGVLMSDGVLLSDHVTTANGVLLSDGNPFLACGVLLGDGVLLSDGVLMSDGVLKSDGVLLGDGVLLSDTVTANSIAAQATDAMLNGDPTAADPPIVDNSPDSSPTGLTATVPTTTGQINLSWSDATTNETGTTIERCLGSTCTNFVQVATVGANVRTFSNTGLARYTAYRYRVRAYNADGYSFYSDIAGGTTK